MEYVRSDEERRREKERHDKLLNKYQMNNPDGYKQLQELRVKNYDQYLIKKSLILEEYRKLYPEDRARYPEDRSKYDLSGLPPDLTEDKAKAIGLKTEIENHILEKLSDYIISKHPRGNYTKTTYKIAIVNVLKNIFKDPNSDIITYIENKLKGEPENKGTLGFFGFGGKRTRRKRKSRRR